MPDVNVRLSSANDIMNGVHRGCRGKSVPDIFRRRDAMDMRVMHQRLSPGMQHAEETDLRPQMLGVGGHLFERGSYRLEQQVVENALILEHQFRKLMRHREDNVKIAQRYQIPRTCGDPLVARLRLALGAVLVAASNGEISSMQSILSPAARRETLRMQASLDRRDGELKMLCTTPLPGLCRVLKAGLKETPFVQRQQVVRARHADACHLR